jgi:hypothetical protein
MSAQLKLVSNAFENGASIPKRYTCEGAARVLLSGATGTFTSCMRSTPCCQT